MKSSRIFLSACLFSIILLSFFGCRQQDRPVVPYVTDPDEVFKRLSPNDEETPEGLTFGKDSIPGIIFDYEMATNDSNIYVFFDKFTLLDVNPEINLDIADFIFSMMQENDFLPSDFNWPASSFKDSIAKGENYSNVMTDILDCLKSGFERDVKEHDDILPPFQMYFLIFPVYLNNSYVTYRLYAYSYTGGAHGSPYSYLRTYDLKTGAQLTLKDIVKPESIAEVREEVVAHMAYSYPIYENITTVNQYLDSLNVWLDNFDSNDVQTKITLEDFPLTDPAITTEGLSFIYPVYELTPGSDGCPLVVIPYHDIKGCLYPQFEK